MAFGQCSDDQSLREAWYGFCDRLKEAGDQVFKDYNPANPLQRADAFRFLTQNLGQVFDLALETKDTRYPVIHPFCTPYRKLGGDCADFTYHQAWIDGDSVYRITGNVGTARFFNCTVQGPRPATIPGTDWPSLHEPFGDIPETNLFLHQMQRSWDGSFEIHVGGSRQASNWLPTTPGSRKLFIRQGFDAWDELPATMSIERIDMAEPRPLPTPETMMRAMEWAGEFVSGLMNDWPDHCYHYIDAAGGPDTLNQFPQQDPEREGGADKKRGRVAASMCWGLKPDEALIIEFDSHDGFWMITNMGAFMSSMDFLYRPVSYTPARTKVDSDGKVRLIMCHDDPGYHNWLDTQGFELGSITYRNMLSNEPTDIRTRLVKRSELANALPHDTARISSEERIAQMHARFDSIRRRYGV